MIRAHALVDYEKFAVARVVLFIEAADPKRLYQLLVQHGEAIERLAAPFGAKVLLAEGERVSAEAMVEGDVADAWVQLVADGRNRSMCTRNNPQRINVDAPAEWEAYAFREILRQVKESTRIIEDVTAYYSRFSLSGEGPAVEAGRPSNN